MMPGEQNTLLKTATALLREQNSIVVSPVQDLDVWRANDSHTSGKPPVGPLHRSAAFSWPDQPELCSTMQGGVDYEGTGSDVVRPTNSRIREDCGATPGCHG